MLVSNFKELYIEELRDLYSAETQLVQAFPKMIDAASSDKLVSVIENHLRETKMHVERLESIFSDIDEKPSGQPCQAMEGLILETSEMMRDVKRGPLRDAALIVMAQKVEHYEIAGYGSMCTLAEKSGFHRHVHLLQATLGEEKVADETLTLVAETLVNKEAVALR